MSSFGSPISARRLGHQRAADREHLLLAAAQRAGDLFFAFFQSRKNSEDVVEFLWKICAVIPQIRAHTQIFHHAQVRKNHAALRRVRETVRDDFVRRQAGDVFAVENNRARFRFHNA
jgi:hypothetical protein